MIDGLHAAAKLFDSVLHFVHPAVVIDREQLARFGGYDSGSGYSADLVTQARILVRGLLAYDPRPAGIFRVHQDNVSRTMKRVERKAYYRQTYAALISVFEQSGADWRAAVSGYLATLESPEIMECIQQWLYYRAPVALQKLGMDCLARSWSGGSVALWRKCASRIGVRNLLRYALSRIGW